MLSACSTVSGGSHQVYLDDFNGQVPSGEVGIIHGGRLYVAPTNAFKNAHIGDDCWSVRQGPRAARSAVVNTRHCRPRYTLHQPSGEYALTQVILREPYGSPLYLENSVRFTIRPGMVTSINLPPLQPGACFRIGKARDDEDIRRLENINYGHMPITSEVNVRLTHYRDLKVSYLSTFEPPSVSQRAVGLSGAACRNDRLRPSDATRLEGARAHYERYRNIPGFNDLPPD